jgi:hypothetical protein
MGCKTFGKEDFMRVPNPAAMMTTERFMGASLLKKGIVSKIGEKRIKLVSPISLHVRNALSVFVET